MFRTRLIVSIVSVLVVLFIGFLSFFISVDLVEMLTGKSITRAYIVETPPENCSVFLSEGLNMVSFPCETGEFNLSRAFSDADNVSLNFSHIFFFNPLDLSDPWKSYNPSIPNWTIQDDIAYLNRRVGYFIFMNEQGIYHNEGLKFSNSKIQLRRGWNLVGYPAGNVVSVELVLSSIYDEYSSVYSYQQVNGSFVWLEHIKDVGGSLEFFVPGYGYWIHVDQSVVWEVSW